MAGHFKFSLRGFSPKRFAYLLDCISCGLLFLHSAADWQGDEYLAEVAAGIAVVNLVLGTLSSTTDKGRYSPFIIALILLIFRSLLQKL